MMEAFEQALPGLAADLVLVVGDVNSTLACALAAVKCGLPVVHVEAGLRSFDRAMPEEINRILVDQMADHLFVTERSGVENLRREGVPDDRVHFTGNTMIDTLVHLMPRIDAARTAAGLGLARGRLRRGHAAPAEQRGRAGAARRARRAAARAGARSCRWCSRCTRARAARSRATACGSGWRATAPCACSGRSPTSTSCR